MSQPPRLNAATAGVICAQIQVRLHRVAVRPRGYFESEAQARISYQRLPPPLCDLESKMRWTLSMFLATSF